MTKTITVEIQSTIEIPEVPEGKKLVFRDGKFSVEVIDETDKVLCNETIGFKEGDNIVDLLKANEKIKLDGTMSEYGIYITTLCGKNASDVGKTYFWSLYVDDKVSEVGLSSVELKNGMKIKLVLTDWTKLS